MTKHFDRTDVEWKPAKQIKPGDKVYGPACHVSQLQEVLFVRLVGGFRIKFGMKDGGIFETYQSSAIAMIKALDENDQEKA